MPYQKIVIWVIIVLLVIGLIASYSAAALYS